jgi:DNA-binding response OmpR family regulator
VCLVSERVAVVIDAREVPLTRAEFGILSALSQEPARVFTRGELLRRCFAAADRATERTVDVHVAHLRQKLGAARSRLETVRRAGYRWRPP